MELTVVMRLRIAAVCAVGIAIIGFGAFGFVRPATPLDAITVFSGDISAVDAVCCAGLAFVTGLIAYLAAYPYGKQIGGLAVPVGLAVWTFRSGTMASLLQANTSLPVRQVLYTKLQIESVLWLAIAAAGFAGVYAVSTFLKLKEARTPDAISPKPGKNQSLNIVLAMVLTLVITHIAIGIFAQDVRMFDSKYGSVIGQPGNGQVAFAVIVSFGIAAFVTKRYLYTNFIYAAVSAPLLTIWSIKSYANPNVLEYMAKYWPANFFVRSTAAILPLQMVCFAVIGSIAGYWIAVQMAHAKNEDAEIAETAAKTA